MNEEIEKANIESSVTAEEQYKESFGMGVAPDNKKTKNALQHALDIRKFEISLYWQRATYFWTLIAATFAGYFAVLAAEHMKDKEFNAYVLSCVGLIFSLAWFLTNRGSKYWQENWENHVDMLEEGTTGPLYKTILHRPKEKSMMSLIEGPAPFSVSQINQWVSLFTVAVWLPLVVNVLPDFNFNHSISMKHVVIGVTTALAVLLMLFRTKSNIIEGHKHSMSVKRTAVID
jgi:Na+/melibiose symporter-like transporter